MSRRAVPPRPCAVSLKMTKNNNDLITQWAKLTYRSKSEFIVFCTIKYIEENFPYPPPPTFDVEGG